ncbi:MAG: biotin--[acetyl-CoA-carboxylase] ligase [Christensenellaceae bacterium]|jgi:BirA family biotin operon repressor/biotin-[acetyl-CoA-carboxylase] ligase|nr:biotin--[acetyl-CoA-carboxylase] ligase [Christensenellaceae bacterium]
MYESKMKVLYYLEKNRDQPVSGGYLANQLSISRNAIWLIISRLRSDGHKIDVSKRGYQLGSDSNMISIPGISQYLIRKTDADQITILNSTESTNKIAKEKALSNDGNGTIIISNEQTKGRGRSGHTFYSPKNTGVYISFVLKNNLFKHIVPAFITMNAAVVACEAIEKISDKIPTIKWVNDILINRKKVAGISTEGITNLENGELEWIVLGIGINVSTTDFPLEIADIATSIYPIMPIGIARNKLIAELINGILDPLFGLDFEKTLIAYKKRMGFIGEIVKAITPTDSFKARVLNVCSDGSLIIEKDNNEIVNLRSGEIKLEI